MEWERRVSKEFTDIERLNQIIGTGPKCVKPAEVTIKGMSLGCQVQQNAEGKLLAICLRPSQPVINNVGQFEATNGPYAVCNNRIGCARDGSTPFLGSEKDAALHLLPQQLHTKIVAISPVGSGKNNSFQLTVGNQASNNITLYYKPPVITSTSLKPYDARGPASFGDPDRYDGEPILIIKGKEFGGQTSQVSLLLSGKECLNPTWHPYHKQDGFPYITCIPQADIVGRKNATLIVAEQSVSVGISILNSMFESVCHPGPVDKDGKTTLYFGSGEELCVLCPQPGTS